MKTASEAEMMFRFRSFVDQSAQSPIMVIRDDRPVAILIGIQDEDEIERLLMAYSPQLRSILDQSRRQIDDGRGIGHEEFWADVESGA